MNRYSAVHQRPEAALQRANDFISVGKEADALNALYEVIKVSILLFCSLSLSLISPVLPSFINFNYKLVLSRGWARG